MNNPRTQSQVQLGCGTLILIALIVMIFSGGPSNQLRGDIQRLESKVDRLQQQVDTLNRQLEQLLPTPTATAP